MKTRSLAPKDEEGLRRGLSPFQLDMLNGWRHYVEDWVLRQYEKRKIRDFESLLSDALLALNRAVITYNGRGRFEPLLNVCLKNSLINLVTKERRRRQTSLRTLSALRGDDDGNELVPSDLDSRPFRYRSRRRRHTRFFRFSSVELAAIQREAVEAYERGLTAGWRIAWRDALTACGKSEAEIERLITEEDERRQKESAREASAERRAKRAAQQRARRQRQRAEAMRQTQ